VQDITGLEHLDDRSGGLARPLGLEDRLMEIVVETLAVGIDAPNAISLENAKEFALGRLDAFKKAHRALVPGLLRGQAVQRSAQIVRHREQLFSEARNRIFRRIFAFALTAAMFAWVNPAILVNGHVWPQWDTWLIPSFALATLLASLDCWLMAGMVIAFGHDPVSFSPSSGTHFPNAIGEVIAGVRHGSGEAIMMTGLLVLIATPVARVALSIVIFVIERERLYAAITAAVFVILMMEDTRGIEALPVILQKVPGIGAILIGEGDLSQELGHPRQYEHPEVLKWMARVVETCKRHNVVVGHPHVDANNVERILGEGYRFLMAAPVRSYAALEKGLKLVGRS